MKDQFLPENYRQIPSAVPGIEVFEPVDDNQEEFQKIVEFKCSQCGGKTAYSVVDGGLTCTHCGYHQASDIQVVGKQAREFEFTLETIREASHGWGQERSQLACQSCGAIISLPSGEITHVCPFCGSNRVIHRKTSEDVLRPRFLIPFQIETHQCRQSVRDWLGRSWMVPRNLTNIASLAKFSGVFIPYWTFDAITNSNWNAQVGHTRTERYYSNGKWKTRTKIIWRWESGQVNLKMDDLLVTGTSRLSSLLLDRLGGYDLSQLTPYDPQYLAGFQAHAYDITLENAWEEARQIMRERTKKACREQASTHRIRNFSMNLDFQDESWRYILLPIYIANYTHEGRNYQVFINGQTSSVAGQRPVDWTRVWMVIGILLAPGVTLSLFGFFTRLGERIRFPIGIVGVGLVFLSLLVAIIILLQAEKMDDI